MRRDALIESGQKPDEDGAPPLIDFGLHYDKEYVRRAYLYINRGWGWPEGGGWSEQDQRLLDDLDTYHEQYMLVSKAVKSGWQGSDVYESQIATVDRKRLGLDEL